MSIVLERSFDNEDGIDVLVNLCLFGFVNLDISAFDLNSGSISCFDVGSVMVCFFCVSLLQMNNDSFVIRDLLVFYTLEKSLYKVPSFLGRISF